jgi:hypothetical protein
LACLDPDSQPGSADPIETRSETRLCCSGVNPGGESIATGAEENWRD